MIVKPLFETQEKFTHKSSRLNRNDGCAFLFHEDKKDRIMPKHESPDGIFFNFSGPIKISVDGYPYQLSKAFFLLNRNTPISFSLRGGELNRNGMLAFDKGVFSEAMAVKTSSHDKLLDNPEIDFAGQFRFLNRPYELSDFSAGSSCHLADFYNGELWEDEKLESLFEFIFELNRKSRQEASKVNAVKKATREELYRRLSAAKIYMKNRLSDPIELKDIAGHVQLNPFHFLRLFRDLNGLTPRQYLIRLRINRACELLTNTDLSITEICYKIGFESTSSFSLLFKKYTGVSPTQFHLKS